jgi:hypothetical protein
LLTGTLEAKPEGLREPELCGDDATVNSSEGMRVWCGAKPRGAKPLEEGKYYLRMKETDGHLVVS